MKSEYSIGGLTAKVGEKSQGYAPILDTGHKMPLTIINGRKDGPTILITAGIHGGEYPSIQAAIELASELDPEQVSGHLIIIPIVNVQGFQQRCSGVIPEDGKNINHLFPGSATGTIAEKIAYVITWEYQDRADFFVDLHGGDIHEHLVPYVYYPGKCSEEVMLASKAVADTLDAKYMMRSSALNGAYNSCGFRGTPCILLERGGRGQWSPSEVARYKKDVYDVLRYHGSIPGEKNVPQTAAQSLVQGRYLSAEHTGCWYPFVELEERVKKGQKMGEIRDYFGNVLQTIVAEFDCVVLYFATSLAISAGDSLLTYAA